MLAPIDRRLSNSLLMSSCFPSTMLPHAKASMGDPPASHAPPSCSPDPLQLSAAARSCRQGKGMKGGSGHVSACRLQLRADISLAADRLTTMARRQDAGASGLQLRYRLAENVCCFRTVEDDVGRGPCWRLTCSSLSTIAVTSMYTSSMDAFSMVACSKQHTHQSYSFPTDDTL